MSTPEQMTIAQQLARDTIDVAAAAGTACLAEPVTDLRRLAAMMLARGSQSVAAANLLAQSGLVGDAMSCGRTVVELAIDFAYIAIEPGPRIRRFIEHDAVHEYRLASAVAERGGIVPGDFLRELGRLRDEFRANNQGTLSNWAGRTIEDRATDGNRADLYRLPYRDQCNASHSGLGTLEYALVDPRGARQLRFGPMTPETHPIVLAAAALLILIRDTVTQTQIDPAIGERTLRLDDVIRSLADGDTTQRG